MPPQPCDLAGDIVPAFRPAADDVAHHVAIDADAVGHVGGLVDQRLLGQALGDRRQLAGVDELRRDPVGLVVFGQRLVFEDVGDRRRSSACCWASNFGGSGGVVGAAVCACAASVETPSSRLPRQGQADCLRMFPPICSGLRNMRRRRASYPLAVRLTWKWYALRAAGQSGYLKQLFRFLKMSR